MCLLRVRVPVGTRSSGRVKVVGVASEEKGLLGGGRRAVTVEVLRGRTLRQCRDPGCRAEQGCWVDVL